MEIRRIPRTIVCTWLRAARLPLSAVETVVRRGDGDHEAEWPPTLAFDSFEASVKQVAGSLLGDDALAQEGQVAQARVAQVRKAVALDAAAEQSKHDADAEFEQRRAADEQRRRKVEQQTEQRERALERDRAEKTRKAAEQDARKRQQVAKVEAIEEKVVAREDRAARTTRISAERNALQHERKAVSAKGRVAELDEELETTKSKRKSG